MTLKDFQKQVNAITKNADVYISPDFQCDQTGGFPVSLCVCWEKEKAWLELNESLFMDWDKSELDYRRALCADFGIRDCYSVERFNSLLKMLGEDAYNTAYLPEEK